MANFTPLKLYILYCLDRAIQKHHLKSPFLDVGCGIGDVSAHLVAQGFFGDAIDVSQTAIQQARQNLKGAPALKLYQRRLDQHSGIYSTILLMDVLEHIEDDLSAMQHVASLLHDEGYVVIAIPSNPREWRWDDTFYGHVRRYSLASLDAMLDRAGLTIVDARDFTFPIFWLMRRIYVRLKPRPAFHAESIDARTQASATRSAWEMPFISRALSMATPLWKMLGRIHVPFGRCAVGLGHEMLVIARKKENMGNNPS